MIVAWLGWGPLIWHPNGLPVRRGWFNDGPMINVEFARQSENGRMTLVLTEGVTPVRSLWALLDTGDLDEAKEALRIREGMKTAAKIESYRAGAAEPALVKCCSAWLTANGLDAVIWTGLPAKFETIERTPVEDEVVNYLAGLRGAAKDLAEEYIRNTPVQIDTNYRRAIEARLNWTPSAHAKGSGQ